MLNLSVTQSCRLSADVSSCCLNRGQSLLRLEICEPTRYRTALIAAIMIKTAIIAAALRGSLHLYCNHEASGNNKIENKHENNKGDNNSLPSITRKPIAIKLNNTAASLL